MSVSERKRARTALRTAVAVALLCAFYLLPWLRVNGQPALLLDLSARQFHLLGFTLQPENALPLLWLVAAAIAALCLVTVVFGRLWCSHVCPQTVLTRVFRGLDRLTTFDGPAKRCGPILRHAMWVAIALWTGISFIGYFSPIGEILRDLLQLSLGPWECFWIVFYALITWANVLYLHEQVCTHLCPYSRVQHLIADARTPTVQYNARRGEPRGPREPGSISALHRTRGLLDPVTASDYVFRAAHPAIAGALPKFNPAHLGDCTDCGACLSVCPIGLDIRNGHSSSCIECGACEDACDQSMANHYFPEGLIQRMPPTREEATSGLRVKPLLFGALMLVALVLMIVTAGAPH
ncbi:4Fe-4S dicluster domain-containing protein [Stenotrophomonas sp. Iso1]|uniref:4Fe-4S dicluster domain-containing protein n=1 Tax=Stenotrophomonas sp. Iso1 TaxID=2977283 RepID=UPI0022B7978B|nr:4Fe-4S dicluster domain-containing protein [Stenotrophomonas sp. Iso1]